MNPNNSKLFIGLFIGLLVGLIAGKFLFSSDSNPIINKESSTNSISHQQKNNTPQSSQNENGPTLTEQEIPQKVYDVYHYVQQHHEAMEGYVGGRIFKNRENQLPMNNENNEKINYQEWDVNPKIEGQNRGTQRLVTGDDNRAWYTSDHYHSFTQLKNN